MTIIIRHRIDAREIPLVFVSADIISIDAADQHVARETLVSELVGVVDDPEKEAAIDDEHIRERIDRARVFVSGNDPSHPPAAVDFERGARFSVVADVLLMINNRDIRALFDMKIERFRKIDIANVVAIAHHDVSRARIAKVVRAVGNRFETRRIHGRAFPTERRKNGKPAVFTREIPAFTGADMLHKRLIIVLRDHADVENSAVYHIRKHEIDQAVSARERNGSERAPRSKFAYFLIVNVRKNYTDGFHNVPSCFFSTISPEATFAPSVIVVPLPISAIRSLQLFSSPTTAPFPIVTFSSTIP